METWLPPLAAFALAAAWGGACRRLGLERLGGAALGLGAGVGFVLLLGLVLASPRQLPERLPMLVLLILPLALLLPGPPWLRRGVVVVAAAWWMAGGPVTAGDWPRAAPEMAGLAALALLLPRLGDASSTLAAAAVLLAALAAAALPGPAVTLAACLAAAALAVAMVRAPGEPALAAAVLAALSAIPVMARGTWADWAALAAVPLCLWAGPPLAARLGVSRSAGWALAAAPALLAVLTSR